MIFGGKIRFLFDHMKFSNPKFYVIRVTFYAWFVLHFFLINSISYCDYFFHNYIFCVKPESSHFKATQNISIIHYLA